MEPIFLQVYNFFECKISFSETNCHTNVKDPSPPYYSPIAGEKISSIHIFLKGTMAQSAGVVEYTDCISAEE